MEPEFWPPSHCEALKEYVATGLSFSKAAEVINARFGTNYSRNAVIGRARRMHLVKCERPEPSPLTEAVSPPVSRPPTTDDFRPREFFRRRPVFEPVERVQLRCVEVDPRHVPLADLKRGDCRYPYGGDEEGEPITFCGHPRRKGSSYCTPHFHLARDPAVPTERAVSAAPLRLVDAV